MEQDVILLADHISFHYFDDNERPIPVLKDLSLTVNQMCIRDRPKKVQL